MITNIPSLDQRQSLLAACFPLHMADCKGRQLSYRKLDAGDAATPTVVLLHGIGSTSASWMDIALAVRAANAEQPIRLIAWDAPGYGTSTPLSKSQPDALDYGQALEDFLAHLGIERCLLVGHSLGSIMAAGYCFNDRHRRVERAIFISPARGYGGNSMKAERSRVRTERLNTLDKLGIPEMARMRSGRLLSAQAGVEAQEWLRWNMASLNPDGYRQAIELLCNEDIGRYAPLTMPLQVFCGEADIITPPDACRDIASRFAASFSLIPAAGHASPVEAATSVASLLLSVSPVNGAQHDRNQNH